MRVHRLAAGLVVLGVLSSAPLTRTARSRPGRVDIVRGYGGLPLSFEPNAGQTDSAVDFVARSWDGTLFLTADGVTVRLPDAAVRMRIEGARKVRGNGAEPLPGTANYFIGSGPQDWRTGLPTYGRVVYPGIRPGVDVAYYGTAGHLEYDLTLSPGTDPSALRLAFEGVDSLQLDEKGDLHLASGGGELIQHRPSVFQGRRAISASYVLEPGLHARIDLGDYDPRQPLLVDPLLTWSTYLGGTNGNYPTGVALDASGNAYITGFTGSPTYPVTSGALQSSNAGGNDAFVTKVDSTGSALVYSTYLGGSKDDIASGIAVDASGNAYIAGTTASADFPTTAGVAQATKGGKGDGFVAKLNAAGSALAWSTYFGGNDDDELRGIALDTGGEAFITGATSSTNLPGTAGSAQPSRGGGSDAFVAKLNATGTAVAWSTYLGGSSDDFGTAIALDAANDAYVTGQTQSTNFPATAGAFQATHAGGYFAAFVAKVTPTGAAFSYATYLGAATGNSYGTGIAVDPTGNAYVAGYTGASDFPVTAGAPQSTNGGANDGFVAKVNAAGTALGYATYLGGEGDDGAAGIAVDATGSAVVVGHSNSVSYPKTLGSFQTSGGANDAVLTRINAAGNAWTFSGKFGGRGDDFATSVVLNAAGEAVLTGNTVSLNYPTSLGALQRITTGGNTGFLTRVNAAGNAAIFSTYLGSENAHFGQGIAVDGSGSAYLAGYTSSISFPTTPGVVQPHTAGGNDAMVVKLSADGSSIVYSTYLGGSGDDYGRAIGVDNQGNAIVAGYTSSTNFPVAGAPYQSANGGLNDAFVSTLNPTGTSLVYSTYLGGSGNDSAYCLAVDSAGNAYVGGGTASSNLPVTAALQATNDGGLDGFIAKLSPGGASYVTYLGGSSDDQVLGIAADSAGAAYVVGTTASLNFPTVGAIQPTLDGGADAFAAKLSPSGNAIVYSTYLGGANPDVANAVAVDPAGNAYVAGQTASPNFPVTPGVLQATLDGGNDAFVAKLNASGSALTYSTFIGGGFDDFAYGIAADSAGNAYVTGNTDSQNFPSTADAFQPALAAAFDAFLLKISSDGSQVGYSTYLGGVGFDVGQAIAFVPPGKVYVGGSTASFNFPTTGSAAVPANPGGNDAFVVQFDMNASADSGSTVDSGNPTPDGGVSPDAGRPSDAGVDAGTGPGSSGCGCQSGPSFRAQALLLALLLAGAARCGRRQRAPAA